MNSFAIESEENGCIHVSWYLSLISYLETYRQHVVIVFFFAIINLLLFFERFWRKFNSYLADNSRTFSKPLRNGK